MMNQGIQQRQQSEFHNRIARIQDPRNMSYIDPETGVVVPKRLNSGARQSAALSFPMALVVSIVFGVVGVLISRYVRFYILGLDDGQMNPDVAMAMDAALATSVVLALRGFVHMQGKMPLIAQGAAVIGAICLMHNAVWMYPDTFAMVFSQDYVAMVQETTSPQTVSFRGQAIPFGAIPTSL